MNCLEVLHLILGEENVIVKSESDLMFTQGESLDPTKVNVIQTLEVMFTGGALFLVTDTEKMVIALPTLVSTDPNHLAFAIHEAFHAKRWIENRGVRPAPLVAFLQVPNGRQYHLIPTWFNTIRTTMRTWKEERETNAEASTFAKQVFEGKDLEEILLVFKLSTNIYNPTTLIQTKILKRLVYSRAQRFILPLLTHMMDRLSRKAYGHDFATQCAIQQSRLMNIPEMKMDREEVMPEFEFKPTVDISTDGLGEWKLP